MLIFVSKKRYEICLTFRLVPASLINFKYTLPLLLLYIPRPCKPLSTPLPFYIVWNAA